MTEPAAHAYFDTARNWAEERDAAARRSQRIAWTIAALACSVAALEAAALAFAMPLKTVVPMAVLVDRTTGRVERVDLDQPRALAANEALQQSLLAQYVVARESYDPVGIRAAYRKVLLWSAGSARASYLLGMKQSPPSAQLATARREMGLATTIRSISPFDGSSALVRFDVAHIGFGGQLYDARPYVATIAFGYRGQPMRIEDRFDNPLGFEVKSYRVDAEAPPPATATAATTAPAGGA